METEQVYPGFAGRGQPGVLPVPTRNELIGQCLRNCVNSFQAFAMTTDMDALSRKGNALSQQESETAPSPERFALNVLILFQTVPKTWHTDAITGLAKKISDRENVDWRGDSFLLYGEILSALDTNHYWPSGKVARSIIE